MLDGRDGVPSATVTLLWIPLGAGGHSVRSNGKVYEAVTALRERRARRDLYHSALELVVPEGRSVVEMTPIPDLRGEERGVVAEGPVGMRWAGRFRIFRYEIRRWRGGSIPDAHVATAGAVRLASDVDRAQRILELVPAVPTPVWGRDELRAGDMWNSNSVIAWLLERGGIDTDQVRLPPNGRAPGWAAGVVVARRREP